MDIFIKIKLYKIGKIGKGERQLSPLFLSRYHACIISSSPRLGKEVFLSLYGQARTVMAEMEKLFQVSVQWASFTLKCHLSINCCFDVWREHVLRIINLLSSLGRMWGSCHHCFIVWGHVSCFCHMGVLLSTPAFSSNH